MARLKQSELIDKLEARLEVLEQGLIALGKNLDYVMQTEAEKEATVKQQMGKDLARVYNKPTKREQLKKKLERNLDKIKRLKNK
jgi:hypothetical protein